MVSYDELLNYGTYMRLTFGNRYIETVDYKGVSYMAPECMLSIFRENYNEELKQKKLDDVIDVRKFFIDKNKSLEY